MAKTKTFPCCDSFKFLQIVKIASSKGVIFFTCVILLLLLLLPIIPLLVSKLAVSNPNIKAGEVSRALASVAILSLLRFAIRPLSHLWTVAFVTPTFLATSSKVSPNSILLRNLETYCKGIIEKFSPEGVYKYEKIFYDGTTSSYMKELTQAIQDGDDDLVDTILDCFLTEEKISVKDKILRNTLKELYTQGYNVFPRTVGKTITVNGEKISLTNSQRARFREVYQDANKVIKILVNSIQYKKVNAEIQAKVINKIYDYYYDIAMEDLTGEDVVNEKDRLFYTAIPIEKLVLIIQWL